MHISEETVHEIAHLARLRYEGEAVEIIRNDLERIISFMEQLNEVDTTGLEPLIFMSEEVNVLRDDVAEVNITAADALKNAPKRDSDYFRIPKVLDKK